MQEIPEWIVAFGPWFAAFVLCLVFMDKIAGGVQKVAAAFLPGVAEKLRLAKEREQWKREQVEREYVDTVQSLKDFVQEKKAEADRERDRADKQRDEWQKRFDERDRQFCDERTRLQAQVERLLEQRTAEYAEMVARFERLESRNLDYQARQTELMGSFMTRLDQMALILAGTMGFPSGRGKSTKDNAG